MGVIKERLLIKKGRSLIRLIWPSRSSVLKTAFEKPSRDIGNALIAEKKLQNYPLSPQKRDRFIVKGVGKKEETKDKFLRHGKNRGVFLFLRIPKNKLIFSF